MEAHGTVNSKDDVWFVYDGECPICNHAAHALRIRKAVGQLHLVDARREASHPLVAEINARGYNLDESMVIKYGNSFYRGPEALGLMSLLGTGIGWFNRMNALLFRYKPVATYCYPFMRAIRNTLIRFKGVSKLQNLKRVNADKPIFQSIFGEAWNDLPPVMHHHYANRPFSHDVVTVEGIMEVSASPLACALSPLLRLTGALVPYEGKNIPVTVRFRSELHSDAFCFDREFRFPGKAPYHFRSRMMPIDGNEVIEYMGLGIGWRAAYSYTSGKVRLTHKGYVWRIFGQPLSIPLELVLGKGYAEEEALTDHSFRMMMKIRHPWFGKTYSYAGTFQIVEVNCA